MLLDFFVFNVNVFIKSCRDSTWMGDVQGIKGSGQSIGFLASLWGYLSKKVTNPKQRD
jgi:hypothetical protein